MRLWHFRHYECAVTLAHAAEGMVSDEKEGDDRKYLFKLMRERMPGDDHNLFTNWLKHEKKLIRRRFLCLKLW